MTATINLLCVYVVVIIQYYPKINIILRKKYLICVFIEKIPFQSFYLSSSTFLTLNSGYIRSKILGYMGQKVSTKINKEILSFSDAEIINEIINPQESNNLATKTFFDFARKYALAHWQRKYPKLEPDDWDTIFSHSNYKLISRLKKGLELKKDTKLTTYYTHVVGYAILDYINSRKQTAEIPIETYDKPQNPIILSKLESEERKNHIFNWLNTIIDNPEQVKVMLLNAEGLSYKEILPETNYESEAACRNALVKGKKKIATYLQNNPKTAEILKKLLKNQ